MTLRQSPATSINISSKIKPGRPTTQAWRRLEPTHEAQRTKPSAVLQSVFFVMVFVSQRTCSTFIFLSQHTRPVNKKIKELHPLHRTKTHAKKNCLKLNNIMWLYRFATHFLPWLMQACSTKKSYKTH